MKIGQAIEYKNEHSIVVRGVITNKHENYIEYFEVKKESPRYMPWGILLYNYEFGVQIA